MKLATRLSAFISCLTGVTVIITVLGCALILFNTLQDKMTQRMNLIGTMMDNHLITTSPDALNNWLDGVMVPLDITEIQLSTSRGEIFTYRLTQQDVIEPEHLRTVLLPLRHQPGVILKLTYKDPSVLYYRAIFTVIPITIALAFIAGMILFSTRWLKNLLQGQEDLEERARKILKGGRGDDVKGAIPEWPPCASSALDMLLSDLKSETEQRTRLDTLIRAFAAQDAKTGLNNRLFFDNQLAHLLENQDQQGSHGIVMLIRLPDFDLLRDSYGSDVVEEYLFSLINLLSTFVVRYPGALLARYFRSDFAVLLPHYTIKSADSFASQLLNAVDALPSHEMVDKENMIHIGICAWRSGETPEQVMEHAEIAVKNSIYQGTNSWAFYDDNLPEQGRGSVKWRTLLEHTLKKGGPRFYQKPAVNRQGVVHHREIMCRIFDGDKEVISDEYLPLLAQFGLSEQYDKQVISRVIPLLYFWPEESFAIQITVESLTRLPFQRWLRNTLMEREKSVRSRIIFELVEADVCPNLNQIESIIKLIKALGVRVIVNQAGLTVVSTAYIKMLDIELIKLHPALIRNIDERTENLLFIQSLVETCSGTRTRVFASGVRTRNEWQTVIHKGVAGGQGDFIASSQLVSGDVKKYSQRYSV